MQNSFAKKARYDINALAIHGESVFGWF